MLLSVFRYHIYFSLAFFGKKLQRSLGKLGKLEKKMVNVGKKFPEISLNITWSGTGARQIRQLESCIFAPHQCQAVLGEN